MEPAGDEIRGQEGVMLSQGLRLSLKPEGLTKSREEHSARGNSMCKACGGCGKLEEKRQEVCKEKLGSGRRWEMRKK